ncbi:MAG: caspase family protein [Candidatus Thiodiazotropha taylori]|nr:caspase family protein [Candidatus Thiodiazotropha taylori]
MQSPFTGVATRANEKLQAWMQRPSTVPEFKKEVPTKEEYPELPTLVKGEFETSAMFKKRVSKAQSDRAKKIQSIEKKYQRDVAVFNKTVSDYNADLEREKQQRKSSVPKMKRQFLGQAMGEVFGSPRFVEPRYDADRQLFNARLVSAKGNFDKRVTIKVPLSKAESFKRRIEKVEPMLSFDIVNDQIKLSKIQANHDGKQYHAQLTDEIYESIPVSVQLAEVDLPQSENISLMTPEQLNTRALLAENASHFQGALQFEDDPALAKQRQELAELERKKREARILQMKEQERQRLQSQIERNRQELARLGGKAGSDYKGLKMVTAWQFKPAQVQPDMVAVVLGNRNYGKGIPLVHYAHNDAKAVKQFLTDSYGLSAQNILYEEDATKGVMDGIFRKRLRNRVKPGQTDVFVYFSGHGMPVGTDAKLLPSDARPETADINGYSRDEMLQQLAGLNAKSLTVVLDSCYSGSSKAGRALQSVKAILAEPKRVQAPKGSVIISAASGKQTAFMDDQSGHSLLTYYLLEGLKGKADQNGNSQVDTNELQKYLVNEVNNAALRLHDQPQNPQVKGESRVLVQY